METINWKDVQEKVGVVSNKLCLLELALSKVEESPDNQDLYSWMFPTLAQFLNDIEQDVSSVYSVVAKQAEVQKTDRADTLLVELAPVQREALDQMVDLTGVSDDSLAQAMFDYGFEAMDGLARLMNR